MGLWSKKSVAMLQAEAMASDAGDAEIHTLKRTLNATNLTLLGIGAIIGAGIFVLTGTAAADYAGPAIVISFVLAGLACLFAGLCYAEFASMIPIAGSAYTYGYATMGELVAWIIGWDLILEYLFAASTVAVGWSGYFTRFLGEFGIHLPASLTNAPFSVEGTHTLVPTGHIVNLPAVFLVLVLTTLLVFGIKESAKVNNAIVYVKVAIVLLVIGFGFMYVNTANWVPFIPPEDAAGNYGWKGIARAAGVIFFAYIGFDAVSTAAQETKNPQRDLPIGILASLAICTVLYILMALVLTGLVKYTEYKDVAEPVFVALQAAGPNLAWLRYAATIGAIAGLASVVLVMLLGQPRIFFAMARDGLLPAMFGKVHPKYRTPYVATIITGGLAAVIAGMFPIRLLGELVSIGTLFAFVVVCAGILVLRYTSPNIARPFRTPFVPLVPVLGILSCGYLMYSLPQDTWLRLLIWLVIGLVIYFTYGKRNSRIGRSESGG